MPYHRSISVWVKACLTAAILLTPAITKSQDEKTADALVEFKSEAGKFSVRLPAKPQEEVVEIGATKEKQRQFIVGTDKGAYIVSYQENPNLKNSDRKEIASALESGRNRLQEVFHGKLLESKSITLNKTHAGLDFHLQMTQPKGEAHCRFYMVGTRLYQIIAMGEPTFANSKEATQVIDSFKLLK